MGVNAPARTVRTTSYLLMACHASFFHHMRIALYELGIQELNYPSRI
jgi:hypothetical protein